MDRSHFFLRLSVYTMGINRGDKMMTERNSNSFYRLHFSFSIVVNTESRVPGNTAQYQTMLGSRYIDHASYA